MKYFQLRKKLYKCFVRENIICVELLQVLEAKKVVISEGGCELTL